MNEAAPMSSAAAGDSPIQEAPVHVVEPQATPEQSGWRSVFHPFSGIAILAIDWLAFGIDLPTGMLLTVFVSFAAFIVTFATVFLLQKRLNNDSTSMALLKAFAGAVAAGIPTPVTGTMVGTLILILSGLPSRAHPTELLHEARKYGSLGK